MCAARIKETINCVYETSSKQNLGTSEYFNHFNRMAQFLFQNNFNQLGPSVVDGLWCLSENGMWWINTAFELWSVGRQKDWKCVIHVWMTMLSDNSVVPSLFSTMSLVEGGIQPSVLPTVSCTHQSFAFIVIQIAYMLLVSELCLWSPYPSPSRTTIAM